jgi:hypothetical protein
LVAAFATLSALLSVGGLQGQALSRRTFEAGIRTGVGYTPVVPHVMLGAGAWHLFGGGKFGVFADAKTTHPRYRSDKDYCPPAIEPCTVPAVEDLRFDLKLRDVADYVIFNAGAVVPLGPEFAVLAGAGVVRRTRFREYYDGALDPDFLITEDGSYYAPHEPATSWGAQAVVAMLIRISGRVVLRFGYERGPGGMSLGGYWALGS